LKINQSGVFDIFEADNYNNSVLYNQDGTKQFNLSIVGDSSSATLQEPYIDDFTLDNEDISIVRKGDSVLKLNSVNKRITPQMLGYNDLSNDIGTDGNYVSDIINKIEESKYELYIPSGLYCLDKSINLFKPASYFWSGGDYNTGARNITTAPKN